MAYDKVVDSAKLDAEMTSLADKLREKGGTADQMAWPEGFEESVDGLNTFIPPSSMALDPDEVYRTTRPKDWLPMPVPGDDEVYLLNLIPEGVDGAFTASISFTGTCTVDFGNLVDGVFVAKESITPTSGTRFYHSVYWDDYGDTTSDGYRQYLVRIKGNPSLIMLNTGNSKDVYKYGVPYVVDAVVGVQTSFVPGGNSEHHLACGALRYVRFVGNGQHKNFGEAFQGCKALMSVSTEKPALGSKAYAFHGCFNLCAVSDIFFPQGVDYTCAFNNTSYSPGGKNTIQPSNCYSMFRNCQNICVLDGNVVDTSQCNDFSFFAYDTFFKGVVNLDISSMTVSDRMFLYSELNMITFTGETTPGGWTIDCSSCIISHKALVNMINSLPTATSPATITITGNPGASALTDAEIAVATAKNWTVTI